VNLRIHKSIEVLFRAIVVISMLHVVFACSLSAETLTLSDALRKGLEYDAKVRMARADNVIYREEIGKARAQLRPNVRLNALRGRNGTQHGYLGIWNKPDYYNTINYGTSIRQPLFNLPNIKDYQESKLVAAKSGIDLKNEETRLIVRVAEAYFNVLYSEENLEFLKSRILATKEQLAQARRRMESGYGTLTEIKEAQAVFDMALAEYAELLEALENSKRDLESLIGIYPDRLYVLNPLKLKLERPVPESVEIWIEMAHSGSLMVTSTQQEVLIATKVIEKNKAERYPTLDLIAGRSYSESENNYSIDSIYDTWTVAVQMSMPIYTGGYVSASVRQAKARQLKAREQLDDRKREVEAEIRKFFSGVMSGIVQIRAYQLAVSAGEIAVEGTRKGFSAGFRSNIEVLDAQQKLQESRRNLSRARYRYILNRLMLKQTAGNLTSADIDEVNGWLMLSKR
jgi:outer membrane protein, protease secretion system